MLVRWGFLAAAAGKQKISQTPFPASPGCILIYQYSSCGNRRISKSSPYFSKTVMNLWCCGMIVGGHKDDPHVSMLLLDAWVAAKERGILRRECSEGGQGNTASL